MPPCRFRSSPPSATSMPLNRSNGRDCPASPLLCNTECKAFLKHISRSGVHSQPPRLRISLAFDKYGCKAFVCTHLEARGDAPHLPYVAERSSYRQTMHHERPPILSVSRLMMLRCWPPSHRDRNCRGGHAPHCIRSRPTGSELKRDRLLSAPCSGAGARSTRFQLDAPH